MACYGYLIVVAGTVGQMIGVKALEESSDDIV